MLSVLIRCMGVFALWMSIVSPGVHAEDGADPRALVERTVTEVLALASADPGIRRGKLAGLTKLVEARIVPHFDFDTMTRLAVGRYWRDASVGQRTALSAQFRKLLVHTYARAYARSREVRARVLPLNPEAGASEVTVKSVLLLPGDAPDIGVDYDLRATATGWKVYNVTVEGVSLVTTYRAEFAEQIRAAGIDGLIARLEEKNRAAMD